MFIIYIKSVSNHIWFSKKLRDFETDSELRWIIIILLSFELNVIKMEDILPARIRHPTLIFVSLNSFKKEHLNDLKIEINFGTNNDGIGGLLPLLPLLRSASDYFSFQKILKNLEICFLYFFGFVLLFAESWLDSWILYGPAFSADSDCWTLASVTESAGERFDKFADETETHWTE